MISITQALIAEHQMFACLFARLEKLLPGLGRLDEVKRMARMVEGLLLRHAEVEDDLLMLTRGQAKQEKRRCDRCQKEHHEIDSQLTRVRATPDIARARKLLRGALAAARKHFKVEEREVFPLIDKVLKPEALMKLGTVWLLQRYAPANWTI